MITVTTTDPAEAEAVRAHMQSLPGGHDYQVYHLGHLVGERRISGLHEAGSREQQWGNEPETRG
jgi:hypothetical protein